MKKILVPIDGSENSKRAAEQAVSLAKTFGGEITFLTVVDSGLESGYSPEYAMLISYKSNVVKEETELAEKMLDALIKSFDFSGLKAEKAVKQGDAPEQIAQYAEEGKYDLIVIGHRGRNLIERVFTGSVAKRVIEIAPCPVLVVK